MAKNNQINRNVEEFDFINFLKTVWDGKLEIAVSIIICLTVTYSYLSYKPKTFTAKTEIDHISTSEEQKYFNFNKLNQLTETEKQVSVFKLTKENLLELYIEKLEERSLFQDAIIKYDLLDRTKYGSELAYLEAVARLAKSIKIASPRNFDGVITRGKEKTYWTIKFQHKLSDISKWKKVLIYVDEIAQKNLKQDLSYQFHNILSGFEFDKEYKIKKLKREIENMIAFHNREEEIKIAFLKEQGAIAEALNISKPTIEVQTFLKQSLFSSLETDSRFYLRGFEAINKEIELIRARTNKLLFVEGLNEKENEIRQIKKDNKIELAKLLFLETPLSDNNTFSAATANVSSTTFKFHNINQTLKLAAIIGLIFGIFYAYTAKSIRSSNFFKK
ncbi:Wzz/FepE/Etk N-terminal domain-containing protein [Candidatus Pelagibacter sp.]|nr:Wzz/FepE/Etk N-terminal domain-containing protein [Candidatus Pelagibacter sp.]